MSEEVEVDHDLTAHTPAMPPEEPGNLLDQLGEKRREIAQTKEQNILVPGYDIEAPLLMIRYRLLDGKELNTIGERVRRETKDKWQRQLLAAVDTFIAAIVGVMVDTGDGLPKPLTRRGEPITTFGPDLAEGLKFAHELVDVNSHRQVVFGLFGNNDVAISQHNYMLSRWMGNTGIDVNRELLEGNL